MGRILDGKDRAFPITFNSAATTASVEMESVIIETNMGEIKLELYWDHAPKVCLTHFSPNLSHSALQGIRPARTLLN